MDEYEKVTDYYLESWDKGDDDIKLSKEQADGINKLLLSATRPEYIKVGNDTLSMRMIKKIKQVSYFSGLKK